MQRTFVKNFAPAWPTDGSSVEMEATYGGLPKTAEILATDIVIPFTAKSTAASFILGEKDHEIIGTSIVKKVRQSVNGEQDNVNIEPDRLRDIAMYAMGQDPYVLVSRVGATVNAVGGAFSAFALIIRIPHININKENPNQNAYSGLQLNRGGKVDLDSGGVALASLNALVLANGTININAVQTPRLFVVMGKVHKKGFVAPTQFIRARSQSQNPDTETGPLLDELIFETRDPRTLDGVTGVLSVEVDGGFPVKNTLPSELAAGFVSMTKPGDGRSVFSTGAGGLSYDITDNQKRNGQSGRSPLVYVAGAIMPVESEVPFVENYRTFQFSTPPAGTIVYWRIGSIRAAKTIDSIVELSNDTSNRAVSDSLGTTAAHVAAGAHAVKGGGSSGPGAMNADLRDYKPVWLAFAANHAAAA